MAETQYLFRLDDACPWMNTARWGALEQIFDRYGVRPIVAVVPQCADPELKTDPEDPGFWDKARAWQAKGWVIGLHGWDHVFAGRGRGLVPLNDYTEFAGRPEAEQRLKIRQGWLALTSRSLEPRIWVAPAHTFDRTTLRCLAEETPIRTVSDGLSAHPFLRFGFTWIPQQLWKPRRAPRGTWTICLHPNDMDDAALQAVEAFLSTGPSVTDVAGLGTVTRPWGPSDALFGGIFLVARALKRRLRKAK